MVIVTERDEVVPAASRAASTRPPLGPKRLVVLDAAHHNDPIFAGEELIAEVTAFLDEHTFQPARDRP